MTGGASEVSSGDVNKIQKFKSILNKKHSKENINFIGKLFLIIGIVVGIEYALVSLIGSNQFELGGTAFSVQFGIFVLLASGVLSVLIGYHTGKNSPDGSVATVSSGVGTFFGALIILFCLLFVEQIISSDFVSDLAQLSVQGSLSMLFVYCIGVAVAGSISSYYGYLSSISLNDNISDGKNTNQDYEKLSKNPINFTNQFKKIVLNGLSEIKTITYLFVFIGIGYGTSVLLLDVLSFDFEYVAIFIAFLGSYAILFFSPLLASVFGYRVGRTTPGTPGIIIAAVGSGLGFVLMFLTMTILGALGVSGNPLDLIEVFGGVLSGASANPIDAIGGFGEVLSEAGTTVDALYGGLLSLMPRAYEISNIMIAGSIGTAVSGGLAAFITNHDTEGQQ